MKGASQYRDSQGDIIPLADLDADERKLIADLINAAKSALDWNQFRGEWRSIVHDFYFSRGLSRTRIAKTVPYRIGRDLAGRLAIAEGSAAPPDYRDDLNQLIQAKFRTRRAFCKATGLSEDMLSHVLSKRKHLSIESLTAALDRVGYALHIAPAVSAPR